MKKLLILLSVLPWLYSCAFAQEPVQKKYAEMLNEESAKKHLTILSSKEYEGRGTGQKGGEKAAQYIAAEFKKLGLKASQSGYFQKINLKNRRFEVNQFTIGSKNFKNGKDFFILGDNKKTVIKTEDIVFVGYGIEDSKYNDYANIDVSNKVVLLITDDEPTDKSGNSLITGTSKKSEWSTSRNKKLQHLMKKNPKLILAASVTTELMLKRMAGRLTGGSYELQKDKEEAEKQTSVTPAVVFITPAIANDILQVKNTSFQKFKENNSVQSTLIPVKLNAEYGITEEMLNDANVLGLLEGTDLKEEIVVLSGHYDHDGIDENGTIFPGADDNGSGTTGVLDLARAFAKAKADGHGPRRSILFIAFAAEEKGLLGSEYYSENPVYPLSNTVVCLNMDMIGRIDDKHLNGNHNYIHVIGSDKLSSELHEINKKANDDFTKMELDYMYDDPKDPLRIYYRSDQYNFAKHKIPVIFYFSGLHPHYHTPEDTIEKIDFPMMVKREKLAFYTSWEIANRDKRLVVDSNKE
ncbi:M28 family peptidase [Sphingobacterium spiritivorum]|uniref:M28 family peptidase n=1 Tax=Sphingobacterium spiritivorum TaxID=258 RepID=UPI003DA22244